MRIWPYIVLSFLILLSSYGCGGSSEVEMNQARLAMDQAKRVNAEKLAPTDFEQAQKAWDHAQTAEKNGKTGAAKVLFTSAKIYFGKAADIAQSKQESLSRELSSMQLMISNNFDQVKSDLATKSLSPKQHEQVTVIASEVETDNASISKLAIQGELVKAVAMAKEVQTKVYNAQLILAGQKPGKQKQSAK